MDSGLAGFLIFFCLIWWIIFSTAVGIWAGQKGRSAVAWTFLAMLISPAVTWLIVFAMAPLPPLTRIATQTCPRCAEEVKVAAKVCRYCGHEFPAREFGTRSTILADPVLPAALWASRKNELGPSGDPNFPHQNPIYTPRF